MSGSSEEGMPTRSRAGVLVKDRTIELRTVPVPDVADTDLVLLAVEANGVCQSDYDQYCGRFDRNGFAPFPLVAGHETVGVVHQVGARSPLAASVVVGDRVAVGGMATCGVCRACTGGHPDFCTDRRIYGFMGFDLSPGLWGGFAEYMVILPGTPLIPVPAGLCSEDAVLFNPLGSGFDWAVRLGGVGPGSDVLVIGPGQRGLACVVAAKAVGARRIIVAGLSRSRWKLDLALHLGATDVIEVDTHEVVGSVRQLTDGESVDVVVDTTPGVVQPIVDAIEVVRPGGTVVLAGLKDDRTFGTADPNMVCDKGLTIRGAFGVSVWAKERALEVLATGQFDMRPMHTHTVGLSDLDRCMRILGREVEGEDPLHMTVVARR